MCVCVTSQIFQIMLKLFQIMLKLQGSTMMRPSHEFFCFVALSPGFRNWVEMTRNMQQEGVGLVFLPRLHPRSVLPCFPARRPHWASPLCCWRTRGAKNPRVPLFYWRTRGAKNPRVPLELMCCEGVKGAGVATGPA